MIKELLATSPKRSLNHSISFLETDGENVSNAEDIVNTLNNYFSTIGKNLPKTLENMIQFLCTLLKEQNILFFFFNPPSVAEVYTELCSLKLKKSTGPDDIPSYFIMLAAAIVSPYLAYFIETSFELGIFRNSLKVTKVLPIIKRGSNTAPENFRPISILPASSKIFEKVLSTKLLSFFTQNSVLQCTQYGFRKKHNTTQAVLDVITHIYDNIYSNNHFSILTLDLTKAFDTINYNILLHKLEHYGIRGLGNKLLRSYLSNRIQAVSVNGKMSSYKAITCGVPQRSILGPLLFLIHINDLPNALLNQPRLYADDTCLLISSLNIEDLHAKSKTELHNCNI